MMSGKIPTCDLYTCDEELDPTCLLSFGSSYSYNFCKTHYRMAYWIVRYAGADHSIKTDVVLKATPITRIMACIDGVLGGYEDDGRMALVKHLTPDMEILETIEDVIDKLE